ncbi:MAG: GGDEF domain-containing protein [Pseudomonadota bacterium]
MLLLNALPFPAAIVRSDGIIKQINPLLRILSRDHCWAACEGDRVVDMMTRDTLGCYISAEQRRVFRPVWPGIQTDRLLITLTSETTIEISFNPISDTEFLMLIDDQVDQQRTEKAFAELSSISFDQDDFFNRAAHALAQGTGYRWAYVTRYIDGGESFEIVGSTISKNVSRVLKSRSTPCETVIKTQSFTIYSEDLQRHFPDYEAIKALGAISYVGQAYFDAQGNPRGHIFAMNDRPDVTVSKTKSTLSRAATIISNAMMLQRLKTDLQNTAQKARTDGLTGLLNRAAFDQDISRWKDRVACGTCGNFSLAYLDLDGMKAVNDARGHNAGDIMLCEFSTALRRAFRTQDSIYRVGGDEFLIVWPETGPEVEDRLISGIRQAVQSVRAAGFHEIDASFGISQFKEAGSTSELLSSADQRMYAHKNAKKTELQVAT